MLNCLRTKKQAMKNGCCSSNLAPNVKITRVLIMQIQTDGRFIQDFRSINHSSPGQQVDLPGLGDCFNCNLV